MKLDLALRAAEALLACCPEDQKPEILARLRDIKAQWEETITYMTHCHRWGSRGPARPSCAAVADPPCPPPRWPGASARGTFLQAWEQEVLLGFDPALPASF